MSDFDFYTTLIAGGRNKRNRPIENNTCARRHDWISAESGEKTGDHTIAIRFHQTDIVMLDKDDSRRLSCGGWQTITTLARLRKYGSMHIDSERGNWYVQCEDDPRDPRPPWPTRSLAKPFHAADPGPEPQKTLAGCLAGKQEPYEYVIERLHLGTCDIPSGARVIGRNGDFTRIVTDHVGCLEYVDHEPNYSAKYTSAGSGRHVIGCKHCIAFNREHFYWHLAMKGGDGYVAMCNYIERFGSREAWHAAYIAELRNVREGRAEFKKWQRRNRVPFFDGIEVTPLGLVPLACKRSHEKQVRREERSEAKAALAARRAAIHARKIARERKREREIRTEIARVLAESISAETTAMIPEAEAWRSGRLSHLEAA